MHSQIHPNSYVAIQLPSDSLKVLQIVPNTTVSLGKYGSFDSNHIIGRPYHLTFEIQDSTEENDGHSLRIVPVAELHMEELLAEGAPPGDGENGEEYDLTTMRTNRDTIDDTSTQKLTFDEIEALKKATTGAGNDIVEKLLESHSAIDKKTAFSLAKYTLRKRKKFLRRFQVLPLDIPALTKFMLEKDASKIMEMRDEMVSLIGCWANVHYGGDSSVEETIGKSGRWLVVDDTGGFVVAAMAERMGLLHPPETEEDEDMSEPEAPQSLPPQASSIDDTSADQHRQSYASSSTPRRNRNLGMSASNNTITVLHNWAQPNLSILKYFSFDSTSPDESHPLHTHLKSVSWMQLLEPNSDSLYATEPPALSEETLATIKPSKRGAHYRKRRRWERIKRVVDETRVGGFNGLVVASLMDPTSILKYAVPLLSGGAPISIYSPHVEPLVKLADLYSTARRAAYITMMRQRKSAPSSEEPTTPSQNNRKAANEEDDNASNEYGDEYFPVDPTLLLAPTIQTSRVRPWQVLPGRTHPLMSGRGGAEGYLFHGTRVLPVEGIVEARGKPSRKRRKVEESQGEVHPVGDAQDAEEVRI